MIDMDTLENAKKGLVTLSNLDCKDGNYTANKMKDYFDTYFVNAFVVRDPDFKAYLNEDMQDIKNREALVQDNENEIEFVRARLESTLDVYATIIKDTESELKLKA